MNLLRLNKYLQWATIVLEGAKISLHPISNLNQLGLPIDAIGSV
jgi:hypothetical protein